MLCVHNWICKCLGKKIEQKWLHVENCSNFWTIGLEKASREQNSNFLRYVSTQWKFLLFNPQNTWNEYTNKWESTEQQTRNCCPCSTLVEVWRKKLSSVATWQIESWLFFFKITLTGELTAFACHRCQNQGCRGTHQSYSSTRAAAPEAWVKGQR